MKKRVSIATLIMKKENLSLNPLDMLIWEQKVNDVKEYNIDTFVMGDDWKGKFDYLKKDGIDVVYLPRTPKVSTSKIKKDLKLQGK